MFQSSSKWAQTLFGPANLDFCAGNKSEKRNANEPLPDFMWEPLSDTEANNPLLIQVYYQNQESDATPQETAAQIIKEMRKNSCARYPAHIFLAKADPKSECFVPCEKWAPEPLARLFAPLPKPCNYTGYAKGAFWYDPPSVPDPQSTPKVPCSESHLLPKHIWFNLAKKKPDWKDESRIGMIVWPLAVWDAFVVPFDPYDLSSSNRRAMKVAVDANFPAKLVSDELLAHVSLTLFPDAKSASALKKLTRFQLWKMCCDEINGRFFVSYLFVIIDDRKFFPAFGPFFGHKAICTGAGAQHRKWDFAKGFVGCHRKETRAFFDLCNPRRNLFVPFHGLVGVVRKRGWSVVR